MRSRLRQLSLPHCWRSLIAGPAQALARILAGRGAPSAAASGASAKVGRINNWTIAIAAGLLEGQLHPLCRPSSAEALDDGENLRILPMVCLLGPPKTSPICSVAPGWTSRSTHADVFDLLQEGRRGQEHRAAGQLHLPDAQHRSSTCWHAADISARARYLAGKKVGFHVKGSGPSVTG